MSVFRIGKSKLEPIKEIKLDLEKDLQKLAEKNLETVFGLKFISSEFSLNNLRVDTLAFDEESKSFVIMEYKKDRSFSVIDQGYAYLALMLNNKADFILEYNEKNKKSLKRGDIDWSQSKVIFLANSFTTYQQKAIHFQDLPIELWEAKKFDNNTVLFNQLKAPQAVESIKTISKNKTIEKVSRQVRKYTVDHYFKNGWDSSRNLFEPFRERVLELDERIEEKFNKYYIGYKIGFYNICALNIYKSKIRVSLIRVEVKDIKDPEKRLKSIPWRQLEWGKQCRFDVFDKNDIDYAIFLIKQVYKKFYK